MPLFAGCYQYRLRQVDCDGKSTYSSNVSVLVEAPKQFRLFQNYPNPFNSITRLEYQVPRSSHIKISVINILGQTIAKLIDENQDAGYYVTTWDGRDENGVDVASGTYLILLQTEKTRLAQKAAVIR